MPEPEAAAAGLVWRSIDELAGLVGTYCWLERRLFEVTGAWASEPGPADAGEAELRVWCAALSRRRGELARRWAEHLPVRAGVDAGPWSGVARAPAGLAQALDELAATKERAAGVAGLVETVLPGWAGVYSSHLAAASPVSEASVMEVLVESPPGGLGADPGRPIPVTTPA